MQPDFKTTNSDEPMQSINQFQINFSLNDIISSVTEIHNEDARFSSLDSFNSSENQRIRIDRAYKSLDNNWVIRIVTTVSSMGEILPNLLVNPNNDGSLAMKDTFIGMISTHIEISKNPAVNELSTKNGLIYKFRSLREGKSYTLKWAKDSKLRSEIYSNVHSKLEWKQIGEVERILEISSVNQLN